MAAEFNVYTLNSGPLEKEVERLNVQHTYYSDIVNNELLPPHITAELASNPAPKVCEMATGTGVWLTDLAKVLPGTAELVGLDYDTTKFPPKGQLPPNVELQFSDMYKPPPKELQGKFDVVHLRLIAIGASRGRGVSLVQNLLSLLKPGGWLVWAEWTTTTPFTYPPINGWTRYQQLAYIFGLQTDRDMELPQAIPHYMKSGGCVDVDYKVYFVMSLLYGPKGGDIIKRSQQELIMYVDIGINSILDKGGVDGLRTREEADALIAQTKRELSGDVKVENNVFRAFGRKPL